MNLLISLLLENRILKKELKRLESPTSIVIRKARISRRVGVRNRRMEMEMPRTQTLSAITATKRVTRGLIALSLRIGWRKKKKEHGDKKSEEAK